MDEEVEISRGKDAYRLLENPLLKEVLETIRERYLDDIERSDLSRQDVREEAFRMLCAVRVIKNHLTSFVNTGKLASHAQLQRIEANARERRLSEWDGSPDGRTGS